jgi:hypothetical protein
MGKRVIAGMVMVLAGFVAFANGNAEGATTVEGVVAIAPDENGQARIMLRTAKGDDVVVDMPIQERQRIQLREQDKVRVSGIYVGVPAGEQVQARVLARHVNADGKDYTIENPIQLTERDRDRIRLCEGERLQTQTQTRDRTQSSTGSGGGGGGTSTSSSGKGVSSPGGK